MSTEEKPLPDFSLGAETVSSSPVPVKGLPRRAAAIGRPAVETSSAFSIIETDEVSRTLDFGMSEEDLEDLSDGEGSSSDLHDSLRALHDSADTVEDDFTSLSADYSSGIREEDTYRKLEVEEVEEEFELPDLDSLPAPTVSTGRRVATGLPVPSSIKTGLPSQKSLSLPDFSKFDEVEEVAKPEPVEESVKKEKAGPKSNRTMLFAILAVVLVAIVVVGFLVIAPAMTSPGVIAPSVDQIINLLQ